MQSQALVADPAAGGPSASGDGGQLRQSDSDIEEIDNPKLLRAVAIKYGIESTQSLVAAYNATTDKDERGVVNGRRGETASKLPERRRMASA